MSNEDEEGPVVFDATSRPEDSQDPSSLQNLSEQPPLPIDSGSLPHTKSNLDLIAECDNFPYYQKEPQRYTTLINEYYAFQIAGQESIFGYVLPNVAAVFRGIAGWKVDDNENTLTLTEDVGTSREDRSRHLASTCAAMRETGHFQVLKGWRNELYPVYAEDGSILLEMERAASSLFGIVTYGVHLTAYVRTGKLAEDIKIWVPRRARTKQTYGGMLDNTVAGGMSVGEDPLTCLVRECEEEASFPESLVRERATSAGVVQYFHIRDKRAGGETNLLMPECQFVYDIELDEDMIPKPNDDEVEEFSLMSIDQLRKALSGGEFKPNCAMVILDFFMRHGILTPQNEKKYLDINARLHRLLEFPTATP